MVKITGVERGSYAEKAGILPGDILACVGGNEIRDVLDYRFFLIEKKLRVTINREGKEMDFIINKKDEYDDIGLEFETYLMDEKHSCKNKCVFCFIDQNPHGMRDSIYFKDDDSRLSFFFGNYVTLTNLSEEEVDRIIKMRISPVNISVHTTNPALRVQMMKNKHSGESLRYLDRFREGEIMMNAQIVLCRGMNDGEELRRSLFDLSAYYPYIESIAVVPAGLTAHREGLCQLVDFSAYESAEVIGIIDAQAEENMKNYGKRLVYASDEWYLRAGLEIPDGEYYEEYPQIENGVGMLRSMGDEVEEALIALRESGFSLPCKRQVSIVTGEAAYDFICGCVDKISKGYEDFICNVYCAKNEFFAGSVTVSGLLTGSDILRAAKGKDLGEELFISVSTLRHEADLFLDNMSLSELSDKLGVRVMPVENDGYSFVDTLLCEKN